MTISADELIALGPEATILNVGHRAGSREIAGAVRYRPSDLLEVEHLALPIDREHPVVLYADHGPDEHVEQIATKLRADGFADVRVFNATLRVFEDAGGETQDPSMEQIVPPQRPDHVQELDRRL